MNFTVLSLFSFFNGASAASGVDATVTPAGNHSVAHAGAVQVWITPETGLTKKQRWLKFHRIHDAEPFAKGNVSQSQAGHASVYITRQATLRVAEIPVAAADAIADVRPVEIKSVSVSCVATRKGSTARSGKAQPSCGSVLLAHGGSVAASSGAAVAHAAAGASVVTVIRSRANSGVATVSAIRNPTDEELTAMVVEAVRRRRAQIIRSYT
jgi:hypothetical protein